MRRKLTGLAIGLYIFNTLPIGERADALRFSPAAWPKRLRGAFMAFR